jgi:hypothetical protein
VRGSARTADIAEKTLDDGRRADNLHAGRMVGPADRVADRAGALATRIARQRLCDFDEHVNTTESFAEKPSAWKRGRRPAIRHSSRI